MWPFFNLTIEVVTFHHRGWCMLGVFLLPAFTCLGHEYEDLLESVRWSACVHRLDLGWHSHPKDFGGNGIRTHVTPRDKSPLPEEVFPGEDETHDTASSRTWSLTHYQLSCCSHIQFWTRRFCAFKKKKKRTFRHFVWQEFLHQRRSVLTNFFQTIYWPENNCPKL